MKNLKNRKIRNHHRLIATLREIGADVPVPLATIFERFKNIPEAENLLVRPNAWVQFANKNEDALIVMSARGMNNQTYTLKNAFAFDDTGRRFTNEEGTRFLTDEEILSGVVIEPVKSQTSEPEMTHEDVLRNLASNTGIILASSIFTDDEVVIDPTIETVDTSEIEADESTDEPVIVDFTELTDNSFDMGNDGIDPFVPSKPKPARHIDPATGKFCSRARAIELGLIAEAA